MNSHIEIVGRSSSHFTRVARVFAIELGVSHRFRPIFDMTSLETANYADNPVLKMPVLVDERGPLFGTENICRALIRRSGKAASAVVMRGDRDERLVANAEELVLHVMTSEVSLIMSKMAGDAPSPKVLRSVENGLSYLDKNVVGLVKSLPDDRLISFVEVALYCVVMHLPWREVMDVSPWTRLDEFCKYFSERESAKLTEYRFDKP